MLNSSFCSNQGDLVCGLCECVEGWLVLLHVVYSRGAVSVGWQWCFHVVLYRVGDKCQCNTMDNSGPISLMCPYVHSTGVCKMHKKPPYICLLPSFWFCAVWAPMVFSVRGQRQGSVCVDSVGADRKSTQRSASTVLYRLHYPIFDNPIKLIFLYLI